jgi:hypothetical protein
MLEMARRALMRCLCPGIDIYICGWMQVGRGSGCSWALPWVPSSHRSAKPSSTMIPSHTIMLHWYHHAYLSRSIHVLCKHAEPLYTWMCVWCVQCYIAKYPEDVAGFLNVDGTSLLFRSIFYTFHPYLYFYLRDQNAHLSQE